MPIILIVKTFDEEIFGAFLSDSLKIQSSFYGTGETFLFNFTVINLI
jgi:hypothetical protein